MAGLAHLSYTEIGSNGVLVEGVRETRLTEEISGLTKKIFYETIVEKVNFSGREVDGVTYTFDPFGIRRLIKYFKSKN